MKRGNVKVDSIVKLSEFIEKSISPFHTVMAAAGEFRQQGFEELEMCGKWNIKRGGKYYIKIYDSSVMAFTVGNVNGDIRLKLASAHTDFPCFKIKPNADLRENGYYKLNTEVYGGAILNTWMDRPLSIAGRVCVNDRQSGRIKSIPVDFKNPVLTIPNLAIHMNRNVNKGIELNKQKDMLPLADIVSGQLGNTGFADRLAEKTGVQKEDILDYEMYIYQWEKGGYVGFDKTLYSSPRLDNITSVCACTQALIDAGIPDKGINAAVFFDNEEIGSRTKQGAASNVLPMLIEKIIISLGKDRQSYLDAVLGGFMVSVDVAHAIHPNAPEKCDISNKPILNRGTVIKIAANQSYAGDAMASSVMRMMADKSGTKYQTFVNRSDMQGGSTLGAIVSSGMPMRTIDIGIPLLAMHSARETMGADDQESLKKLLTCYFS